MPSSSRSSPSGFGDTVRSQTSPALDDGNADYNDDGRDANSSRAKRQRVHFSCSECHRRKQKCDRKTPCNHCIARKIPERCKTFQPGEEPGDLLGRLNRLEASVNAKLDHVAVVLSSIHRSMPMAGNAPNVVRKVHSAKIESSADMPIVEHDILQQAEGSEAGDEVMLHNGEPTGEGTNLGEENFTTRVKTLISEVADHKASRMADPLMLTAPLLPYEQSERLDAIMHDFGATYSISKVLLAALPPAELCRALVDHFFENNWLRQPLSRRHFMERYDAFWREGPVLTVNNLNVYALYLLTASLGVLTYRGPLQISEDPRAIRLLAKRLFFAARQSLLISSMLGREDVEQVIAFHLASRFLFIDRRISEAWSCVASAVKTAHSIGLHRDGALLGLPEKICAARRRIWSITYFTERILCMNLGRPTAIDDEVVDTAMVNDVDIEGDFAEYTTPPAGVKLPPGEIPRFLTFTLMRQHLATIIGRVISIYQNIRSPAHYSDVVDIDNSLEALHKSLPDHLKSEFNATGHVVHLNEAWDDIYPFVPVHRYLQQAEILFVRMSLHRPYLIRPATRKNHSRASGQHHHRYNFSRRSCIEAAYQTLILRKDLSDRIKAKMAEGDAPPSWVAHLGTYNTLSAIVILGIYLLMEPKADNAEMLLRPLRMFYELYQKKRQSGSEDLREREFTILHMFLERIDEARTQTGKRKRAKDGVESVSASHSGHDGANRRSGAAHGDTGDNSHADEQDTAGALLDLKSIHPSRKKAAASQPSAFSGRPHGTDLDSLVHAREGEEGSLPWPYLPLHTPHHPGMHPKPSNSIPLTASPPNAASTGDASNETPPGRLTDTGRSSTQTDSQSGASVHQLFDSWFRSNAFENADVDVLGMGANPHALADLGGVAATSATALGGPLSGIGGPYLGYGQPSTDSQITSAGRNAVPANGVSVGVQWSTVPAPSYDGDGQPPYRPSAAVDHIQMPGEHHAPAINMLPEQTPNINLQSSTFDSTYDPAFWQSLIDKISQ